jgi:hypothetical protein
MPSDLADHRKFTHQQVIGDRFLSGQDGPLAPRTGDELASGCRPRGVAPGASNPELYAIWLRPTSERSVSGTVSPSALAVLRLIRKSNLVSYMTGRSAGFSPLRIRPT